jgi:hypothetical protein
LVRGHWAQTMLKIARQRALIWYSLVQEGVKIPP